MESEGRTIHGEAEEARERGDFLSALKYTDEALLAYQERNDDVGFSEVLASRSLTLRYLYSHTDDKKFLTLSLHEMEASVEIARSSGNREALALPLYNLAKTQEDLGMLENAIQSYKEAIENIQMNSPEIHNRPSVVADMKVHLATAEYKNGDKSALIRAEDALSELISSDEPSPYNKSVWVSGGHMRIAEVIYGDNREKAEEHLNKAREMIDSDRNLKLQEKKLERISQSL